LRRFLLASGLLLPAGYAVFFAVAEARLFDYRVAVFPQFSAWVHTVHGTPLYGYQGLDSRLIYYAQRTIPLLDEAGLQQLRERGTPMLLLVEGADISEVKPQADCLVREFKPYLKKDKTLAAFGFGSACNAQ
jgi:hypothetical protein